MLPDAIKVGHPDRIFVGGDWIVPHSRRVLSIVSPDNEEVVATVAESDDVDMDQAVDAARQAFDRGPWATTSPQLRAAALVRMADELERRLPELCLAWNAQVGGLASFAPMMHGGAIAAFRSIAAMGKDYPFVARRESFATAAAYVVQEPVGVVAAIAPWNAPFGIMASKVAYALLAGCTVIMKPSPETPLEAYIIAEAGAAAGLPPGVLNLVAGERDAADHLVRNPGVDKVSFTGSTAAGKRIGEVCAGRVARCTLELGGKSAAIVRDDFPIGPAAALLSGTLNTMSGQVCAMLTRVIVSRARHDELAEAIAAEMARVHIGHSTDVDTQLGPVAMKRQLERIESYIELGKKTADLVHGGARPTHLNKGYFVEPTLFANVDNASKIAQEEIFGPVLCLIPADDDDHAVAIANDSPYGLNGSVLTNDADAAFSMARQIRTGSIGQNGLKMDFNLPYGGFKQSGIGREGGREGLQPYLETKTILLEAEPSERDVGVA